MSIQIQGNGGTVAEVDGTTHRALRVAGRPTDALGHYSLGQHTGIIGAAIAANSEIFQFRWSHATKIALVRRVFISANVSTTFFAAGVPVQLDLVKSTSWTVAGTGGTGITPVALLRRRQTMDNTLHTAGDIRISTTAALGAGTKTLETYPLAAISGPGPITGSLNGQIIPARTLLFDAAEGDGDHPLTLIQNEGFSIRANAVPATGTWMATVTVDWAEVTAY